MAEGDGSDVLLEALALRRALSEFRATAPSERSRLSEEERTLLSEEERAPLSEERLRGRAALRRVLKAAIALGGASVEGAVRRALLFSFMIGGLLSLDTHRRAAAAAHRAAAPASARPLAVSLVASTAWERETGRPIGDGLYPFVVAQAHHPTRLALRNDDDDDGASGLSLFWRVADPDVAFASAEPSAEIELTFPRVGRFAVEVFARHDDAAADAPPVAVFDVHARLVRRELRSLDDDARERYFAALRHVYFTPQAEGEARWGTEFRGAAWLVREHLYGAADKSCDHWHDDARHPLSHPTTSARGRS